MFSGNSIVRTYFISGICKALLPLLHSVAVAVAIRGEMERSHTNRVHPLELRTAQLPVIHNTETEVMGQTQHGVGRFGACGEVQTTRTAAAVLFPADSSPFATEISVTYLKDSRFLQIQTSYLPRMVGGTGKGYKKRNTELGRSAED